MSKAGTLWTDIELIVNHPAESRKFDNLISLLDIQLDRAAGQPLDVIWGSRQLSTFDPRLMNLLRRKGPFSQWRTLEMRFRVMHPDDANIFHPSDAFSNLESIVIYPSVITSVIRILNLTTTSKLQAFEYRPGISRNVVSLSDCSDMLRRIHRLTTELLPIGGLSSNITHLTHLDSSSHESHKFPHLKMYNLYACIFTRKHPTDLRCLETFKTTALVIRRDTEVYLPALRHLKFGAIRLHSGAKIITPLLESLHITGDRFRRDDSNDDTLLDYTGAAIKNEGFLSLPSHSLTVDHVLFFHNILKLLERSPRVEKVSLGVCYEEHAMQVLERIGGATLEDDMEDNRLCGQLRELRLTSELQVWEVGRLKERAARVVRMRMRNGFMLQIFARWCGKDTYLLLA
jgi:hypothetical protein